MVEQIILGGMLLLVVARLLIVVEGIQYERGLKRAEQRARE